MPRSPSLRTLSSAGISGVLLASVSRGTSVPPMRLTGVGPAYPRARDTQIAFIRSRVAHPLAPPEWIAVDELEERWSLYEIAARLGLTLSIVVALPCVLTLAQKRKKPNPSLEPAR